MGKEEKIMYFDKTTVEAEELKEKVGQIHATLMKSQEIDDYIFSIGGIASEPVIHLPFKFAIVEIDRFIDTEDPKQHLLQYLSFVKMEGLNERQVLYAFPLSLSRIAAEWYYTLDVEKTKVWKELINLFMNQFAYNTMVDLTFKDLETMQQNDNETFLEFQARWRAKAAKMTNRLDEKDQVNVEMKNLLPNKVCVSPIMDFEQSYNNGMRIEDIFYSDRIEENEGKVFAPTKKVFRSSSNAPNILANINAVHPNQYQRPSKYQKQYQTQYGG